MTTSGIMFNTSTGTLDVPKNLSLNTGVLPSDMEYKLMQFTGLLSKSGKEIYEGDIFRHNDNNFVCAWTKRFGFVFVEINKNLKTFLTDKTVMMHHNFRTLSDIFGYAKYTEIIGNIYENPELIK